MGWYKNYPHGGPPEYSYTSDFVLNFEKTGQEAEQNILNRKNAAGGAITDKGRGGKAIAELNRMIVAARSAEQQFLMSHGFKNPGNNWNKLITDINKILSTEAVFKRNVQLLKQFNEGSIKNYQDVSVFFKDYLKDAIYDNLVVDVNATGYEILLSAVKKAIQSMANITETKLANGQIKRQRTNDETKMLQAFSELFGVIEVIENSEFLEEITEIFQLEDYIEQVRQDILQGNIQKRKDIPKLTYKGGKTGKGTLAEILYTAVARGLGSGGNGNITWQTVEHTGGVDYKPDRVLATMNVSYNAAVNQVKNDDNNYGRSVRAKGIATMEHLYKDLKDAKGDIVLISDKNYLINGAFIADHGFKAQGETSLNALAALFNSLHINVFDIDALIDYLANIGNNLIETSVDNKILRAISAQIGNFLFDDLSFEESVIPSGVNAIHVFNLSGIYMPLSIVLEGVKNGLGNIQHMNLESYVSVDFKASSDEPGLWVSETDGQHVFEAFRNAKLQNNTISINFLQDFAAIIATYVKI